MVYKARSRFFEAGKQYKPGDKINLSEIRARQLGDAVEPLHRMMENPAVAKQFKRKKRLIAMERYMGWPENTRYWRSRYGPVRQVNSDAEPGEDVSEH